MDTKYRNLLRSQPWDRFYKEMVRHTAILARTGDGASIKVGVSPEDIAATVMRKVWEERTVWKPEKCDFLHFLKWACSRELDNFKKKKKVVPLEQFPTEYNEDGDEIEKEYGDLEDDPLIQVLEDLGSEEIESIISDAFGGDEKLEAVYYSIADGTPPREVAKQLGLKAQEIYNARKVVIRRLAPIKEKIMQAKKELQYE